MSALLDRINALAKKSREEGLTDAEKEEQARLRKEYLADFRKNLRGQLENIEIEYSDGRVVTVKELHDEKIKKTE